MDNKIQERIYQIQAIYREWMVLHEKLEAAYTDLIKSTELMQQMETFYLGDEYRMIYERIESGEQFDLTTQGEYSIMSEDTIWDAIHQQHSLLWKHLRLATQELGKDK